MTMHITPLQDWICTSIGSDPAHFEKGSIERWQFDRIRDVIAYVRENSPFYAHSFADLPSPRSLEDFAGYPFTTAEDLREDPARFVCVAQDEILRIVTLPTSGTTGPAKRIYFTAADQELTIDFFHAGMSTLARSGDRVLILLPCQRPGSVGDLLRMGLERLGCIPFPYGPYAEEQRILKLIDGSDINVLVGSPVQLHRLARVDQFARILKPRQIKKVLTSTDILPETIRLNLQRLWGCEVFDHYGMTETGLGGGVECEAHQGYHLREADLYIEIIDPLSGRSLSDGETGEIVVTTLTRTGMPLVRYRTGDVSRLLPGTCACGSHIRRLEKIHNRMLSGVKTKSGILYPSNLDEVLFKIEPLLDFSAVVEHKSTHDELMLEMRSAQGNVHENRNLLMSTLEEIPVIGAGLRSGTLRVEITPREGSQTTDHRMLKRSIQEK